MKTAVAVFYGHRYLQRTAGNDDSNLRSITPFRKSRLATLPLIVNILKGEVLLTLVKKADHPTLQVRRSANFIHIPISLNPRLSFPLVPSSLLGTIGIGDTYRRKERGQAIEDSGRSLLRSSLPTAHCGQR